MESKVRLAHLSLLRSLWCLASSTLKMNGQPQVISYRHSTMFSIGSISCIEKEIYLDLSDFNHSSHDFDLFIRDLTKYAKPNSVARDLEFEKTLLYVTLPDLQLLPENNVYDTIGKLFSWLRTMNVHTIKELNIPDRRIQPLTEDFVYNNILKHFRIERLDWRKLDMDISVLRWQGSVSFLKGLKLYSSGSWSVLYHWASEDGVSALTEVSSGIPT